MEACESAKIEPPAPEAVLVTLGLQTIYGLSRSRAVNTRNFQAEALLNWLSNIFRLTGVSWRVPDDLEKSVARGEDL